MLGSDVFRLPGICGDVVELFPADQSPAIRHHRAVAPLLRILDALRVRYQGARLPALGVAGDERHQAFPQHQRRAGRPFGDSAVFHQCRQNIDVGGQSRDIAPGRHPTRGPADEERHAVSALIFAALRPAHAGIEALCRLARCFFDIAGGRPVVRHEDQDRVLLQTPLFQLRHHRSHVFIDVGDHPVERRVRHARVPSVHLPVLVADKKWAVGRIRTQVGEERLIPRLLRFYEFQRLAEPDIGAVAVELLLLAVDPVGVVEVVVSPDIWELAHATATVPHDVLESDILRPRREVISEVPLAKHPRRITRVREYLAHRRLVAAQDRTSHDRVPHAGGIGIAASHQRGSRRRTGRAHVEICQPCRLGVQLVQARRPDQLVAVAAEIAVSLIVRDHHDHVRPRRLITIGCGGCSEQA